MMQKQHAITLPGPWPQTESFIGAHIRQFVAKLKGMFEIPTGYQDESGFHLGAAPARKEIQWPPV
jgi:hypothetical protein